jgi:hypothetical protein
LLVAIAFLGLFIVVFERRMPSEGLAVLKEEPLLPIDVEAITRLSVVTRDFKADCVARNGKWRLVRPVETRADAAAVTRILEALNRTVQEEVINVERQTQRGLSLASFGLDVPRARLFVGTEQHQDEVVIGGEVPLTKQVYVMLGASPDVVAASGDIEGAIPLSLDGLRDRAVIPAAFKRISRMEIKHAEGFVQLVFRGGEWRIQQPQEGRADGAAVERLIGDLRQLSMESFGGESLVSDPVSYGFGQDEAVLQVSVWQEGSQEPIELVVGKDKQDKPDLVYARVSDMGAIGLLRKELIAPLMVGVESLDDRRLCDAIPSEVVSVVLRDGETKLVMERQDGGGWVITDPFRRRADAVAVGGLLRRLCNIQAEPVTGLAATNVMLQMNTAVTWRVELSTVPVSNKVTTGMSTEVTPGGAWTYLVATNAGDGSCVVYHEEAHQVLRIRLSDFPGIAAGGEVMPVVNALQYMDRKLLDLDSSKVRRLTLMYDGVEESVVRDAQGRWAADSPPEAKVSDEGVTSVLQGASELRAERVESALVTNLAFYGLGEKATRLTIGLSGSGGIQKTVVLGATTVDGNVYAALQGQDVVFVLRKDMAAALMRRLVVGQ